MRWFAATVAALALMGGLAGAAWALGWVDDDGAEVARPTMTETVTASPTSFETPSAVDTPTPSAKTPQELRSDALAELETMVTVDAQQNPIRGQWVAQLASKYEGVVDATQQDTPFTLPEILQEVNSHRDNPEYGFLVRVVRQGDWGRSTAGPVPMWVTFADIDRTSRDEVVTWCESQFTQRGEGLLNVCYPRQLHLK